jgi:hypothetical protein
VGAKIGFHGGRNFGEFPRQNSMIFEGVAALLELRRMGKEFENRKGRFREIWGSTFWGGTLITFYLWGLERPYLVEL